MTPGATRLLEGYLAILLDAGLDEVAAAGVYTALYYLALGQVVDHAKGTAPTPAALAEVDDRSHPLLAVVAPAASQLDQTALHEAAIDVVIAGVRARLTADTRC